MPDQPSGPVVDERDSARRRLLLALRRPSRGQAVVAMLLALLGFAGVTQVRDNEASNTYAGLRDQELIEILDALTGTAERARSEIDRLEEARSELQSESSSRQAALEQAQARVRTLNILAGLVPVTGPGLRITITPGSTPVSVGSLLDMVQELRTADAEAMEFNDRIRVVAQTSFNATVSGVELGGQPLEAPYVIDVIGDPHTLHGGLTFNSGPIQTLEQYDGATVTVQELEAVDVESVRQLPRPGEAEPEQGQ